MNMPKTVKALIFLLSAGLWFPFSTSAYSAPLDSGQATTLLAKARAVDLRCNILSASETEQLKDYVARAEISLAEKESVIAARKALAEGRKQGQLVPCDLENTRFVREIYAAAGSAVMESDMVAPVAPPRAAAEKLPAERRRPVVSTPEPKAVQVATPHRQAEIVKPVEMIRESLKIKKEAKANADVQAKMTLVPRQKKPGKLVSYASVVERYYFARRCNTMSNRQLVRLYDAVLAEHRNATGNNARRDIRLAVKSAEIRANGKSCN